MPQRRQSFRVLVLIDLHGCQCHNEIRIMFDSQPNDTAINLDREEWVLDPDKTLAESMICKLHKHDMSFLPLFSIQYCYNMFPGKTDPAGQIHDCYNYVP